jgi:hypothetical protein
MPYPAEDSLLLQFRPMILPVDGNQYMVYPCISSVDHSVFAHHSKHLLVSEMEPISQIPSIQLVMEVM